MDYIKHGLRWKEYQERKKLEYGDKFDSSDLAEKWIPAFCTGERIRVRFPWGEVKTGTVSVTTGWRPAFLLIRSRRCHGSSDILDLSVVFTSDKVGRYTNA